MYCNSATLGITPWRLWWALDTCCVNSPRLRSSAVMFYKQVTYWLNHLLQEMSISILVKLRGLKSFIPRIYTKERPCPSLLLLLFCFFLGETNDRGNYESYCSFWQFLWYQLSSWPIFNLKPALESSEWTLSRLKITGVQLLGQVHLLGIVRQPWPNALGIFHLH